MKEKMRTDLKKGLTIAEVCQKYNMSFKQLCETMRVNDEGSKKSTTNEQYVSLIGGRYVLRKNGVYFGQYNSLEDAVKVRDYCIANGWYKKRLEIICEEVGVKRMCVNG